MQHEMVQNGKKTKNGTQATLMVQEQQKKRRLRKNNRHLGEKPWGVMVASRPGQCCGMEGITNQCQVLQKIQQDFVVSIGFSNQGLENIFGT